MSRIGNSGSFWRPGVRWQLALVMTLLVVGSGHAAEPQSGVDVSSLIEEIGSTAGTPMIDVAIVTALDLCYAGRFEQESGVTLVTTEDDELPRFHSASISKLFTAAVVMQLRDEGRLSLSDRVGEYLPAFREHEIRLQHLLTHTSGLRDRKRSKGRTAREDVDDYIVALAKQRPSAAPGDRWSYSDAGFNVLGRVIENVTGQSFPEVLKTRLLQPLGMKNSSFDLAHIPMDRRVLAFDKRGRQQQHPWDQTSLPSAGLQTNARDLAKFAQAVLSANTGPDSHGVLRFETLQEMTAVRMPTEWNGIEQAYAWQVVDSDSEPVWRHAGGEGGFESLLAIYPNAGIGIVVLGNQKDWPRFRLVRRLKGAVSDASADLCDL